MGDLKGIRDKLVHDAFVDPYLEAEKNGRRIQDVPKDAPFDDHYFRQAIERIEKSANES